MKHTSDSDSSFLSFSSSSSSSTGLSKSDLLVVRLGSTSSGTCSSVFLYDSSPDGRSCCKYGKNVNVFVLTENGSTRSSSTRILSYSYIPDRMTKSNNKAGMLAVTHLQLHKLPTAKDFHWSYLSVLLRMFPMMEKKKANFTNEHLRTSNGRSFGVKKKKTIESC